MRATTLAAIDEAVVAGAGRARAAELCGVSVRTIERWRKEPCAGDRRAGPEKKPSNRLSDAERQRILDVVNTPEYRDLSPKQIVPALADAGRYIGSESTIYRVLRAAGQLAHRGQSRAPRHRTVQAHVASAPNRVWSWDITYLRSERRGEYFRLYLVLDIWSRKIVAWEIHEEETAEIAAGLIDRAAAIEGIAPGTLVLHSDNGSPMKGSTMLAKLEALGVATSFSRPRTSNDNAYSESAFKTLKYRPEYPSRPFASIGAARAWVAQFVAWYNDAHLHSAIRFVTPADRHAGRDAAILAHRRRIYAAARRRRPDRWTGSTRNWSRIETVALNPERAAAAASNANETSAA